MIERASQRPAPRAPAWIVLAAVAATFAGSLRFPFAGYDDPRYAVQNPLVTHPLGQGWLELLKTPRLGYPQPVTVLSYALNRLVLGPAPWGFHLVNVLLHLGNVAMVRRIASGLGLSARAAAVAAMVFGLHPLVVEPVCWITGRKDLLATGLVLAGLAILLGGGTEAPFPRPRRWAAATLCGVLAIGAKPSVAIAPAILAAVLVTSRPRWAPSRVAAALAPLGLVGALALLSAGPGKGVVDVHPRSVPEIALDVLGAWALQLGHLVFPVDLVVSYARLPGDPSVLAMAAGALVMAALAPVVLRPRRSPAYAGLAWAVIAYAPMSGLLGVNRWTADSYMYLPLAGIVIAAVAALAPRVPSNLARAVGVAAPALGAALALESFAQSLDWRTPEGPWVAVAMRYPTNPVAYSEAARTLAWEGRRSEAQRAFLELDRKFPDFEWSLDGRADAQLAAGNPERARALLERGIRTGVRACADAYWMAILQGQITAMARDQDAIATSFDLAWPDMQQSVQDPVVWSRVAAVLDAAGLSDRAARVRERAPSARADSMR
jgi:hypothetical protein